MEPFNLQLTFFSRRIMCQKVSTVPSVRGRSVRKRKKKLFPHIDSEEEATLSGRDDFFGLKVCMDLGKFYVCLI